MFSFYPPVIGYALRKSSLFPDLEIMTKKRFLKEGMTKGSIGSTKA